MIQQRFSPDRFASFGLLFLKKKKKPVLAEQSEVKVITENGFKANFAKNVQKGSYSECSLKVSDQFVPSFKERFS